MISARNGSRVFAAVAWASISTATSYAWACGASAGGAAGLAACSLSEHDEETRPKWHLADAASFTSTGIRFDDGSRFDQERFNFVTTLDAMPVPKLALQIGAGPAFPGAMHRNGERHETSSGVVMLLGGSYRFVDSSGARPYVLGTLGFTFLEMQTRGSAPSNAHALYDAFDFRMGAVVGWTISDWFSPYLLARAFGGPVNWTHDGQKVTGTDVNHYQLGVGISAPLGKIADIFLEAVPLGEQGMSGGFGVSF